MHEMADKWHKKYFSLIFLCLSFIVIVISKIYLSYRFSTPFVFPDEYLYTHYTQEILQNPLSVFTPEKDQIYPPGFSLILIPSFLLYPSVSAVYSAILAINILLSTSLIFITFFILKRYISERDALLGSILITLLPFVTINNYIIFSENLYIPVLVFACLLFIMSIEIKNPILHFFTGFIIGYLPLIRAFGILALLSFYLVIFYLLFYNKDRYYDFLKERLFLIITPIATFGSYVIIKILLSSNSYGYNSGEYYNVLIWVTRDFSSFLVFLRSFAAEIDYLIITTYVGFLILAAFLAFSWKKADIQLKSLFLFTLFYACFSIILTILHMLLVLQSPDSPSFFQYLILGRYLDPLLPLIFILGLIYLFKYVPDQIKTPNKLNNITGIIFSGIKSCPKGLILSFMGASVFFLFTYPTGLQYKVVNVSAIYYLDYLNHYSGYLFYALPVVLSFLFLILCRHPRYLMVLLILFSLFITVPTFLWIQTASYNTNSLNMYEKIFRDREGRQGNIIYMDNDTFSDPYTREHSLLKFWGMADQFYYTNNFSDLKIQPDYIITQKTLPYKVISIGPNSIITYRSENTSGNFSNLDDELIIQKISNTWVTDNVSIMIWNPSQYSQDYDLKLRIISFFTNRTVYITMNNVGIYQKSIRSNKEEEMIIPLQLKGGFSYITVYTPDACKKPSDVSLSTDQRCLTFKIINLTLNPQ